MNQKKRILEWFKEHRTLDRLQAFTKLGIFELSARICELKRAGYNFDKRNMQSVNKYGDRFSYVEYRIINIR